jgi:hypothetical protein
MTAYLLAASIEISFVGFNTFRIPVLSDLFCFLLTIMMIRMVHFTLDANLEKQYKKSIYFFFVPLILYYLYFLSVDIYYFFFWTYETNYKWNNIAFDIPHYLNVVVNLCSAYAIFIYKKDDNFLSGTFHKQSDVKH